MMEEPVSPIPDQPGSGSRTRYGSLTNDLSTRELRDVSQRASSRRRNHVTMAVLCYINLINYMERFTIAGVLLDIQKFFGISDSTAALLQTVFLCSFLLLAPLFGYLGDRFNRKYIMLVGLSVWIATAAAGSFVTKSCFWFLILMRALVGIGEASYSTIAPTIISDLYTGAERSAMICIFYIIMIVSSGLGYLVGAGSASLTGDWRWALRITPILGSMGLVLLIFLCPNPPRGAAETHGKGIQEKTSYLEDIKYLLKHKSYTSLSLGAITTSFNVGVLSFWMPTFLSRARVFQGLQPPCTREPCSPTDSYIFGALTVVSGILGGCLGYGLSRKLRDRVPNVDPLICGIGVLGACPCFFITIFVAPISIPTTCVFIFISEILVSLNLTLMADMVLYIVVPTRRASAEAFQIMLGHLLGDAISPYIVGLISDTTVESDPESLAWSFHSLQYSLLISVFVAILGGIAYFLTAHYITADRQAVLQLAEDYSPLGQDRK
ncbi:protein spinster homolog 3 [Antennarius striatus]|uniref:protein spinster homolog 3 n=1 Tax=Antennarius striatus TaxID=241820 RepID=UPI0035B16F62